MRNIIKQLLKEEIDSKSERVKSIVNKYGLKQASEMIVGGKETIKQAYQDNPSSFLEQFNDLTPVEKGGDLYYVNKDRSPLFAYSQDRKSSIVWVNYDRIWMFFEEIIGLDEMEIQDILKYWLEETYNITGLTPLMHLVFGRVK
jgi:hypothetical protein